MNKKNFECSYTDAVISGVKNSEADVEATLRRECEKWTLPDLLSADECRVL